MVFVQGRRHPASAVIGAGISGIICARTLADHGLAVTVFDKGRGTGGRAATRRAEPDLSFDHGAQYFTARDPSFASYVSAWRLQLFVAEWGGRVVKLQGGSVVDTTPQPRYVGTPEMSALGTHLAADLAVRRETRISRVSRTVGGWNLTDDSGAGFGPFEFLVMAIPAPQAAELLAPHPFAAVAASVPMTPCWAVLVAFDGRYEVPWDGAFVHDSPLSWMARNSSKPGRLPCPDCWVLHAGPEWSAAHLEDHPEAVGSQLLDALVTATGIRPPAVAYIAAHRWLFSQGADPADRRALFDPGAGLVMCGDWLAGGRVEGAFLSGVAAAGHVLRQTGIPVSSAFSVRPCRHNP